MSYGIRPCRDPDCWDDLCIRWCNCDRGRYAACRFTSCYECYLDRQEGYVECIFCGKWHSDDFPTCFDCRVAQRDEAGAALRQLILWRDNLTCRYCGIRQGEDQIDPRLVRPACTPRTCRIPHNHRRACRKQCKGRHEHRKEGDDGLCPPKCDTRHSHWLKHDDGLRHAILHVDHIVPCREGGTADEWNLQTLCGVCNIAKGSQWWPGCRHDAAKTKLCAAYFLISKSYFDDPSLEKFNQDVTLYRQTRTWDPQVHASILNELEVAS